MTKLRRHFIFGFISAMPGVTIETHYFSMTGDARYDFRRLRHGRQAPNAAR